MSRGIAKPIMKSGRCRRTRKNGANLSKVIIACGACRRADQYVQVAELLLPILKMNCSSASHCRQSSRSLERAIGDKNLFRSARPKSFGGLFAGFASSENHDLAPV